MEFKYETKNIYKEVATAIVISMLDGTTDSNKPKYYIHVTPVNNNGQVMYDAFIFQDFKQYDNLEKAEKALQDCIANAKAWGWKVLSKDKKPL